jgi:hypothetical protein
VRPMSPLRVQHRLHTSYHSIEFRREDSAGRCSHPCGSASWCFLQLLLTGRGCQVIKSCLLAFRTMNEETNHDYLVAD